jgi:hypothetical protein
MADVPARGYRGPPMKRFWHHHGLSLVISFLFLGTYVGGQLFTGWKTHNEERTEEAEPALALREYLTSAHFWEATTENWESEFLQMFLYVFITAFLFQKGSAESNDPDKPEPPRSVSKNSPWAVRRGGWVRRIYSHSLSLSFALLFAVSFWLHAVSSTRLENEERQRRAEQAITLSQHLGGSKFWFESFQNWQSEFLAIGSMVVLSIFLREKNSPESKPVEAPHAETGA